MVRSTAGPVLGFNALLRGRKLVLYLINCTAQHFTFNFRDPRGGGITADGRRFLGKVISLRVASGQQEPVGLGVNWSREEEHRVIEQIEQVGARSLSEISGNMDQFGGLMYSDGLPASEADIKEAHRKAIETAHFRSAIMATRAALGFARRARTNDRHARAPGARMTEVEVVQQAVPGESMIDPVDFSIAVDPDGSSNVILPGVKRW